VTGPRQNAVQSLPETVQVLRPPGTWAVPGAFGQVSLARCSRTAKVSSRWAAAAQMLLELSPIRSLGLWVVEEAASLDVRRMIV
jgi:hypothetical protein